MMFLLKSSIRGACLLALTSLVLFPASGFAAGGANVTKVAASGEGFDGDPSLVTAGRVFISTPTAFRRTSADGLRTAKFEVRLADNCTARLSASIRGVATRSGPRTQLSQATRHAKALLGEGQGTAGPWRAVELPDSSVQPRDVRPIYGIASKRVARHRYVQVRVIGDADRSCSDQLVRDGVIANGVKQILNTARIDIRLRSRSSGRQERH